MKTGSFEWFDTPDGMSTNYVCGGSVIAKISSTPQGFFTEIGVGGWLPVKPTLQEAKDIIERTLLVE